MCSHIEYTETPFNRVREEYTNLQNQYYWLEHITRGVSRALDNCGPRNILRDLAKKWTGQKWTHWRPRKLN